MTRRPPISTLSPYTTLFRSDARRKVRSSLLLQPPQFPAERDPRGLLLVMPRAQHLAIRDRRAAALGVRVDVVGMQLFGLLADRKSTRLNSSHSQISYAVFCL